MKNSIYTFSKSEYEKGKDGKLRHKLLSVKTFRTIFVSGKPCKIDVNDYALVSRHRWILYRSVPSAKIKGVRIFLKDLIYPPRPGFITQYKNSCSLDNRKINLKHAKRG